METIALKEYDAPFVKELEARSGEIVWKCYQCGKCSAGCPVAFTYDWTPNQIMRLLQIGIAEPILKSRTVWLCAQCVTCTTRCPREIDVAKVMETLHNMARERGVIGNREVKIFEETFAETIRRYGKIFEAGLLGFYNLKSGKFFNDLMLAPNLLLKGKVSFFPSKVKGSKAIKKIFEKLGK